MPYHKRSLYYSSRTKHLTHLIYLYSKQGSIYNKLFYANFQFVALTLDFCPPFLWCDMYVRYRLLLILETLGLAVLLYYIHVVPNAFQYVH